MILFEGFKTTVQGESHKEKNLSNQDYADFMTYKNHYGIAIVADGHGSEKHFRSQYGSKIAVTITHSCILDFMEQLKKKAIKINDQQLKQLEKSIITRWHQDVIKHFNNNPLSEYEMKICTDNNLDINDEKTKVRAYGTTLIAAMLSSENWFMIQIGDGKSVLLDAEGEPFYPINEDENLGFGRTTSLCDSKAIDNFRHKYDYSKAIGITVATDGVTDSFIPEEYLKLHKRLYDDFCTNKVQTSEEIAKGVAAWSKKGSRDDASMAGIFFMNTNSTYKNTVLALIIGSMILCAWLVYIDWDGGNFLKNIFQIYRRFLCKLLPM